jgi:DNA processing protein
MNPTTAVPPEARRSLERVVGSRALDGDELAERYARAAWCQVTEPGDAVAGRLVAAIGARAALHTIREDRDRPHVEDLTGRELSDGRKRWMPRLAADAVGASLDLAARAGVRLLVPDDPEWPAQFTDLGPHAPLALWVRGDASVLTRLRPSIAIVGARAATSYGDHVAVELTADLAGSGIPIVSGAAYGIDGAAHRAALAVGGTTVALLAGGVDRSYPAGHAHLLDRIAATGAVVGETPCGTAPTKWRFLQRNRLIAALADATVVVEAGWRSGSLNTVGHALTMGRPVGAVPGPITSAASAGAHRLLRESEAACITCADDVRELLGMRADSSRPSAVCGNDRPPTDDRTRVRDALSTRAWRDTDELARRSGMSPSDVEAKLGLMLLGGEIERSLTGWRLHCSTSP